MISSNPSAFSFKEKIRIGETTNSTDLLIAWAEDTDLEVRAKVASNPHTPAEIITRLAEDEQSFVRLAVSQNVNAPEDALRILLHSREKLAIRHGVLDNPGITSSLLRLLKDDSSSSVAQKVAAHPAADANLLDYMSDNDECNVAILSNQNTSFDTIAKVLDRIPAQDLTWFIELGHLSVRTHLYCLQLPEAKVRDTAYRKVSSWIVTEDIKGYACELWADQIDGLPFNWVLKLAVAGGLETKG